MDEVKQTKTPALKTPQADCDLCPRLAAFREQNKKTHPDFFNAPVPNFGEHQAQLAIIGLAPGLKGANRTGRVFTGDYAGDLLFATLAKTGFAAGDYQHRHDDGLTLHNCRIINAVRCVPPQNKPSLDEIKNCSPFLHADLNAMPRLCLFVALGRIAHDTLLRHFGITLSHMPFAHGALHHLPDGKTLLDSYHCSRYNTQTGRLKPDAFEAIFIQARRLLSTTIEYKGK